MAVSTVRMIGDLNPTFAWDGARLYGERDFAVDADVPAGLRGAASSVAGDGNGRWRLLRDPLGIDKLFWAGDGNGGIHVAATPKRLVDEGHELGAIRALPRGCVVDIDAGEVSTDHSIAAPAAALPDTSGDDIETVAREIERRLHAYLDALAGAHPSADVYVCLSGGLDSSGIGALVREHFSNVVAVSFDIARPSGCASDDRLVAERLAGDFGMPFVDATVTVDELLELLDLALVAGIDWRDFNVHAALVNAVLAKKIAESRGQDSPEALVFTGDLANEFLVDYHAEHYSGGTYYALPSLEARALRAQLIHGLDTSHREIGVFAEWGLAVIQPYAIAVDAYLSVPEELLVKETAKQILDRAIFGDRLPAYIYDRPKVRAQVGSSDGDDMGVLGACVDRGVTAESLKRRFAELHGVDDPAALDRFIRFGRYRSAIPGR